MKHGKHPGKKTKKDGHMMPMSKGKKAMHARMRGRSMTA